jgi:hypothetical protein
MRCTKDSALIAIRLLANAMGLKVQTQNGKAELVDYTKWVKKAKKDDVLIDQLGGVLVQLNDPELSKLSDQKLLLGLLMRADKELAHLTTTFDPVHNTEQNMLQAIGLVEKLINSHLYKRVGRSLPMVDK